MNNKWLVGVTLVMAVMVGYRAMFKSSTQYQSPFFDDTGQPTEALKAILAKGNVPHDGTRSSIIAQTQKLFIRPANKERYQLGDAYADRRAEFEPLLDILGMLGEVKPQRSSYDYVLINGGTIDSMRERLAYLCDLWQQGVRFNNLVLLSGERPLFADIETDDVLEGKHQTILPVRADWQWNAAKKPKTEMEALQMIYQQAQLPMGFRDIPVIAVLSPMKKDVQGVLRRPTTKDTYEQWMALKPQPGTCLLISSQPFVGYQDVVARCVIPTAFTLETVGPKSNEKNGKISVMLDSLARWLYQEAELVKG